MDQMHALQREDILQSGRAKISSFVVDLLARAQKYAAAPRKNGGETEHLKRERDAVEDDEELAVLYRDTAITGSHHPCVRNSPSQECVQALIQQ